MSEMGEIDKAALEENQTGKKFRYLSFDSTCLVEEDEEPPGGLNQEALEIALEVALLLEMNPVDQIQVMRKLVIDGSNTSGFQRTALIARGGQIETEEGVVRLGELMLEEESAKRIEEQKGEVIYSLDRIGIPLVEISTLPDIKTPDQARNVAARIGMLLRSTGKVKRGIGTIRQDINISINSGSRVELKGVQNLDDIEKIIQIEIDRQRNLIKIQRTLESKEVEIKAPIDITDVFRGTSSEVIQKEISQKGVVMALPLEGFQGILGEVIAPNRRLGTELSDYAKKYGAGGIFHTDELPGYGITQEEIDEIRRRIGIKNESAFAIVAARKKVANEAIIAVLDRAKRCLEKVPEETRGVKEDGTSRYLRPLPGEARMYPETDVLPVKVETEGVRTIETLETKAERYNKELGVGEDLSKQMAYSERMPLFEKAVETGVEPTLAIDILENKYTELRREKVPIENISDRNFEEIFQLVTEKGLMREGITDVMKLISENKFSTVKEAMEGMGWMVVGEEGVREIIEQIVKNNEEKIKIEGKGSFSALMGECMTELRGKTKGSVVSSILQEEIEKRL
jgi:glutamyl-tRNA(Gln) amidotransferase subunit E